MPTVMIRDAYFHHVTAQMAAGTIMAASEDQRLSDQAFRLLGRLVKEANERAKVSRVPFVIETDAVFLDELVTYGYAVPKAPDSLGQEGLTLAIIWPRD